MRLFKVQFGGPKEMSATLADPGDMRAGDDELPLVVVVENHTDGDLTANLVKVKLKRIDKKGSVSESTRETHIVIPAGGKSEIRFSHGLSLSAVGDQLPAEVPAWMRTAVDAASSLASMASDAGDFEVSVAVYCEGVGKPATDSREIKRYGPGGVGVRL